MEDKSDIIFKFDQSAKEEMSVIVEQGGGGGSSVEVITEAVTGAPIAMGLKVDDILYKIEGPDGGSIVEGNPEDEATAELTKIKIDNDTFSIPAGTDVVANPALVGTEVNLTGLQVADVKYKVPFIANSEVITNKVTSLSATSTDTQYPSAKCVYDLIGNIETLLAAI